MPEIKLSLNNTVAIQKEELNELLTLLQELGYQTVGPRIQHEVLAFGPVSSLDDLPQGYTSIQDNGQYRLQKTSHKRYFDITPGSQTWKQYIYPARQKLFELKKENGHWERVEEQAKTPRYALIGVRPCDLAAIDILDKVLIREDFVDPDYSARRSQLFILAVECLHPAGTCFCASMGTGPEANAGFDLKLTELEDIFLVTIGSDNGLAFASELKWSPAGAFHQQAAQRGLEKARAEMGRQIEAIENVPDALLKNLEHPHWNEVGQRCMSCGNCTFVCPTCFCWDAVDEVDITTRNTSRSRVWDSCFNLAYSAQAGGNTRPSTKSRYRQWLSHKFGNWKHQFGVLGCVGCGRCITWCPAGIDVTAEVRVFQEASS